ncbi:MAG: helix-turn-helix domain-containing protein, partial [Rhodoferax sp.]
GNVRQLENICHWLTVMAPAQVIEPKDLPPEVLQAVQGQAWAPPPATATGRHGVDPAVHADSAAVVLTATPWTPDAGAALGTTGPITPAGSWEHALAVEAQALLAAGRLDVWDELTHRFESRLILTALASTKGRRIEAAHRLGIGRNTITRKIQELGLE